MIRTLAHVCHSTKLRSFMLAGLAVFAGASCDDSDPLASSAPTDLPISEASTDSSAADTTAADPAITDSISALATPEFATSRYSGRAFGPIGLWSNATSVSWGPYPFTGTQNYTDPSSIVKQINAARWKGQRLILAMTGGPAYRYTTNGKFDLAKWKNRMNAYRTSTIRNAVAAAVADGTVIGNQLIDEPETPKWGGVVTKGMINQMAVYSKNIFPTLPVGVNHGPPAYQWRSWERYSKLDFVLYQYNHYITDGNVASWRDRVLSRARYEGVTPMFSLNLLNGGVQDRRGSWDCGGTGGKGTRYPNCRMTATQVRSFGRALAPYGCALQMWRYDDAFMSKSANQDAFRNVASLVRSLPRHSCRRP